MKYFLLQVVQFIEELLKIEADLEILFFQIYPNMNSSSTKRFIREGRKLDKLMSPSH